jgi:hypothetical protein
LWGPASAALGRDDARYRISDLSARNPAQRLELRFTAQGVALRANGSRLSLRLADFGRGASLNSVAAASPHVSGNDVTYDRGAVQEWYVNGPLGLEQGFVVGRRPGGRGPLDLTVALAGALRVGADGSGGALVSLAGGGSLRYSGLSVLDARGHALRAWLGARARGLSLYVDDRGARYPLRIDPFIRQGKELLGIEATGASEQGFSVALSKDGNTALIGGPDDNGFFGAAWVFVRSGSKWRQQAMLVGTGAVSSPEEGYSVALSADGNTALIGGPFDRGTVGAAWVFRRSGSTWSQEAKLVGTKSTGNAEQGTSVALSQNGSTALIGGPFNNVSMGAAWVFTRTGSKWSQQGDKLVGSGSVGAARQGFSVALSGDATTALIGGPDDNGGAGAAWAFTRSGSRWSQQGKKLVGSGASGVAAQGSSVALSADGSTALIGGPSDHGGAGAAWVFTRSGSKWSQQGKKLVAKPTRNSAPSTQATSVALSGDGSSALIGGTALVGPPASRTFRPVAWLFHRFASTWAQLDFAVPASTSDLGGVALSADATTALVGTTDDNSFAGGTWPFVWSASTTEIRTALSEDVVPPKRITIAYLLKHGGYTFMATALTAGRLEVRWSSKGVLVASGAVTFKGPTSMKLKLKLTNAGRRLLRKASATTMTPLSQARSVKMMATGKLKRRHRPPVTVTRTFKMM